MKENVFIELKNLMKTIDRRMFAIAKMNENMHVPSPLQNRILEYLINHQDEIIYAKDLESKINVSKGALSTAISTMEQNGYVKRIINEKDARNKIITLTDTSINMFNEYYHMAQTIDDEIMSGISKKESEEFYRIVEKMIDNLKGEVNVRNPQYKESIQKE